MLLLNSSKTITVDGVTVFPDHADEDQFWYLPAPVRLARRPEDDRAKFTLIKYKPAAVAAGVKGGGFLMFEVNLTLDAATERRIRSRLSGIARGEPRLTVVPFDEGTVQCIALNLQGSGGTEAGQAREGTFNAVEKILGATTPSLQGDNTAAFSLTLDQEGAIILEQAFVQGTTPVGILYDLKFTGIRPALSVKITADFKRIYNYFGANLTGQYAWFQVSIEAALEFLVQEGAITIEVINFTTEGDKKEKEKWALEFFMNKLLADWFQPTLSPGQPKAGPLIPPVISTGGGQGGTPPPTGGTPPPTGGTPPPTGGTPPPTGGTPPPTGGTPPPTGIGTPPAADTRQAAALRIETTSPNPLPAGYSVTHTPAATGTVETIVVQGGAELPLVRVNGQPQRPNLSRQLTVDVQPGTEMTIEVEYPAAPDAFETFRLLFDKDEPIEAGWVVSDPPSGPYRRYIQGLPTPPSDVQFNANVAPNSAAPRGAAALRAWVQNRLAAPKQLQLDAHASFEGDSSATKREFNRRLSQRRLDVANGLIGSTATITSASATGQADAEAAGRRDQVADRVVNIVGRIAVGSQAVTVRAKLARPAQTGGTPPPTGGTPPPTGGTPPPTGGTPPPTGGTPPPTGGTPPPTGGTPPPTGGTPPPTGSQGGGGVAVNPQSVANAALALKLKFVHQEELKTMTLSYNSSEALQRTYAPQGFFGLLLDDLQDKDSYFVEVDLDHAFFRVFEVTVDAPIDFSQIGLNAAHVALDYGSANDANNHRHAEFVFDGQSSQENKFHVFMNQQRDTDYRYGLQYHFSPTSGWDGQHFSYDLRPRRTEDRTLYLNPYEDLGFLEIQVLPNRIDWGVVNSTDVLLRYQDSAGWIKEKVFTLTATSEVQSWKLRLTNPNERGFTYRMVHHLKDGSTRAGGPFPGVGTAVMVDDPFEGALELLFFPAFDATHVKTVFIDVLYDDDDLNYHREERLRLGEGSTDEVSLRISLMDPTKREFQYRFVFIDQNGNIRREPFVTTTDTEVSIR
jgi:hypothetical protein